MQRIALRVEPACLDLIFTESFRSVEVPNP